MPRSRAVRFILAAIAGIALLGIAFSAGLTLRPEAVRSPLVATDSDLPRNTSGLTYGVIDDLRQPDLISVTTDQGVDGYAYALQLLGRVPTTPPSGNRARPSRDVPVYDLEGTTLLGTLRVG